MDLAGDNLRHLQFVRQADLTFIEVESALARLHSGEINFFVDVRCLQSAHQPLGTTYANLCRGYALRTDFKVLRHILKNNGHVKRDFGRRLTRNCQPQAASYEERNDLQPEIMKNV